MNAAAVIQIPLVMSIWDDGYGISVDNKIQTVKSSISEIFLGFPVKMISLLKFLESMGRTILKWLRFIVKQKKLPEKISTCFDSCRQLTQPQGHSTSGSHEIQIG